MIYKWTSFISLILIIFLSRCYWHPVLESFLHKINPSKNSSASAPIPENILSKAVHLNGELRWKESTGIMPFIGAKNFQQSRQFYAEMGFLVGEGDKHCRVKVNENLSFWLQNYYNKEWANNSMIFLDIPDIEFLRGQLLSKNFHLKYKSVRFTEIQLYDWGREFFMHDPSGILWHFCEYKQKRESPA